jgi:Domain of unknown function (DUF4407)
MKFYERAAILGGADPSDPLEPNNRVRHVAVGGLLVTIALWALMATTAAFRSNLKAPWPAAVAAGLLIATVIFSIDVLITCTPLKADTTGQRARIVLIRGMVSLAMGLVISQSTIMFMYRDSLAQIVSEHNQAVSQADADRIRAQSQWTPVITDDRTKAATYETQIHDDDMTLTKAQGELNSLKSAWLNDLLCVHGGTAANGDTCGRGPTSDQLEQAFTTYQNVTLPAIQATQDSDISSARSEISALNSEISQDTENLTAQIQQGTSADLTNTGLAAQSDALWTLLERDKLVWLWPLFFIVIDLAVALMKGILPESDFDRTRRRDRELDDALQAMTKDSAMWHGVADHAARRRADVAVARIDADADRKIDAIKSRATRSGKAVWPAGQTGNRAREQAASAWRRPRFRRRLRWGTLAGAAVVIVALLIPNVSTSGSTNSAASPGLSAKGGGSINLSGGEKLTIPVGAITGNALVTATYTTAHSWAGNSPASDEVTFASAGTIVGKPVLSLPVAASQVTAAQDGALAVAYWSPSTSSWTSYPATYDPRTGTMRAVLTHFSTWRFWTRDWGSDLAMIGQAAGALEGRRATGAPDCATSAAMPGWFRTSTGITESPGQPVLGCVMGSPGSNDLDIELVNNRPYGLMLSYGGATVTQAQHDSPVTLTDGLRDAIGDFAARTAGGLYLPPLSRASIEIVNTGQARNLTFTIAPTQATIVADALDISLGPLIRKGASAAAAKWGHDVFAAAAGSCTQFMTSFPVTSIPDQSTVMSILTSAAPQCLKDILTAAAGGETAVQAGIGDSAATLLSTAADGLEKIISIGKWADIEDKLGKVLDFAIDRAAIAAPELGYGFSVLAA